MGSLIQRWDGSSWSVFTRPDFGLDGVTCSSTAECWAVGRRTGTGFPQTLILRYTGAAATPTPSPSATVNPSATPSPSQAPPRFLNISTRQRVGTGENVLIGGFIINGDQAKTVVLRGIGPSLSGNDIADPLLDPVLELNSGDSLIATNDNWKDNTQQQQQMQNSRLAPTDDRESAIAATLNPGLYTATVRGKGTATGVALIELYDISQSVPTQLANISTRGLVQAGQNVMIGGFFIGGESGAAQIVLRGIGSSLKDDGVQNTLEDPTLDLRDNNGERLVFNDDFGDDPGQAAVITSRGLAPEDRRESAIAIDLPPGQYTAILAGKNGGTGVGLVEVYNTK